MLAVTVIPFMTYRHIDGDICRSWHIIVCRLPLCAQGMLQRGVQSTITDG